MDELEHVVADINWIRQIAADKMQPQEYITSLLQLSLPVEQLKKHPIFLRLASGTAETFQQMLASPLGYHFFCLYLQNFAFSQNIGLGFTSSKPEKLQVQLTSTDLALLECLHCIFKLPKICSDRRRSFMNNIVTRYLSPFSWGRGSASSAKHLREVHESVRDSLLEDIERADHQNQRRGESSLWYEKNVPTLVISTESWCSAVDYLAAMPKDACNFISEKSVDVSPTATHTENAIQLHGKMVLKLISIFEDKMSYIDTSSKQECGSSQIQDANGCKTVETDEHIFETSTQDDTSMCLDELTVKLRTLLLVKFFDNATGHLWKHFTRTSIFIHLIDLMIRVNERKAVNADNFLKFRILGRGAQGEVYGGIHNVTGKPFAIKEIRKSSVMRTLPDMNEKCKFAMVGDNESTLAANATLLDQCPKRIVTRNLLWHEREALIAMATDRAKGIRSFVLSLAYSYQTPTHLALVFDIMIGGSLQYYLKKQGRFEFEQVQFYAAEVALGLEHLHSHGIIYRDLKPHNIMLDSIGHICITDLGLVHFVSPISNASKSLSMSAEIKSGQIASDNRDNQNHQFQLQVGTRGYWAPEVLKRRPLKASIADSNVTTSCFTDVDGATDSSKDQVSLKCHNNNVAVERVSKDSEKLDTNSYSFAIDWWSFGVVIYQLLSGVCPFRHAGLLYRASLDPRRATADECRAVFDAATLQGTPDFPQALRLVPRKMRSVSATDNLHWQVKRQDAFETKYRPRTSHSISMNVSSSKHQKIRKRIQANMERSLPKDVSHSFCTSLSPIRNDFGLHLGHQHNAERMDYDKFNHGRTGLSGRNEALPIEGEVSQHLSRHAINEDRCLENRCFVQSEGTSDVKSIGSTFSGHQIENMSEDTITASQPGWLRERYELRPIHTFCEPSVDLLRKLFRIDPATRLGGSQFPSRHFLRNHLFFKGLDWDQIRRKRVIPPFRPSNRINADSQKHLQRQAAKHIANKRNERTKKRIRQHLEARKSSPKNWNTVHGHLDKKNVDGCDVGSPGSSTEVQAVLPDVPGWDFVCEDSYQREIVQILLAAGSNKWDLSSNQAKANTRPYNHRHAPSRRRRQSPAIDTKCNCMIQ